MVTPCINNIQHFNPLNAKLNPIRHLLALLGAHHILHVSRIRVNNQLTHTTLKNLELLIHFKISKTAPTCFGLQGNHHQGATIST